MLTRKQGPDQAATNICREDPPSALGRASMVKKGIYVRTVPSLVGPDAEKVAGSFDFGRVDPGIGRERE